MKNFAKLFGIIALAAVIGISMTACGDSGGGGSSASLGATLNLSGQVYRVEYDNNDNRSYVRFTDDRAVSAVFEIYSNGNWLEVDQGGSGAITAGQLSFSIGTPNHLEEIEGGEGGWNNLRITPASAQFGDFWLETPNGNLRRERSSSTSTSRTWEQVAFTYVDRDVNIRADRRVQTNENVECRDGECWDDCLDWGSQCWCECWCTDCRGTLAEIEEGFNINLRRGWNALLYREAWVQDLGNNSETWTISLSAANPGHLRWVLSEWGGWSAATAAVCSASPMLHSAENPRRASFFERARGR